MENLTLKQKIILGMAGIVLIGVVIYNVYLNNEKFDSSENLVLENETMVKASNTVDDEDIVVVHMTGCVKNPGVVKLKEGSRIEDAIEAAGGLTDDADISNVNLAYVLDDGTKIKIPSVNEIGKDDSYISEESGADVILNENTGGVEKSSIVNINKASEVELQTLPGIGASLAGRIIEYRETNGKFKSIEDIKNVSGIGEAKFDSIKDFITV